MKKKKNLFRRLWEAIISPFVAISVCIGESMYLNENGSWDKYWERKNQKSMKRMEKKNVGHVGAGQRETEDRAGRCVQERKRRRAG